MAEVIERPNYYQLQFLGADDFKAEQAYHRDMRRRHNLGPHRWGIVTGLELLEVPRAGGNGVDVFVSEGMALDGYGREILVGAPHKLDAADLAFVPGDKAVVVQVWIAYDEVQAAPAQSGFGTCESEGKNDRVQEDFRVFFNPSNADVRTIVVNGRTADAAKLPADQSVPYQELPDEVTPRWLVRLGNVKWDAKNKLFLKADNDAQRLEGRVYAGVIAEEVLTPAARLRLAPRKAFAPDKIDEQEFAVVEGRLRVEGSIWEEKDVYLLGGKASFRTSVEDDGTPAVPLWIQRLSGDAGAHDLRIHIGTETEGEDAKKHRLTIGPGPEPTALPDEKVVLAVRGDDVVDIPTGTLHFGAKTRQMIALWGQENQANPPYGIGIQAGALYFRSALDYYWYRGGSHDDANGKTKDSGIMQLHLDSRGDLNFGARTRQMLNLWNEAYGIGIQFGTLYFRTDNTFCWFRGGTHADGFLDAGGGTISMRLDDQSNLSLAGNLDMSLGKGMKYGGQPVVADVVFKLVELNKQGLGGGGLNTAAENVHITSRLPRVGGCEFTVALAEIHYNGTAENPLWQVRPEALASRIDDHTFNCPVRWGVRGVDAHLKSVVVTTMFFA